MHTKVYFSFKEALKKVKTGGFYISYRNQLYPFWWSIKDPQLDFTVFVPGRNSREKDIPVFQRKSYADFVNSNVISIFDPSLFKSRDIGIAWCVGDRLNHHALNIGRLLNTFFDAIQPKNVLIYASSAGGIPAFFIANEISVTNIVYFNNIQTKASAYHHKYYMKMIDTCFPKLSALEFENTYSDRASIIGKCSKSSIVYSQNIADTFHFDNHYSVFKNEFSGNALFIEYNDIETGHDVLSRDAELGIINSLLTGEINLSYFPFVEVKHTP